MSGQCFGAFEVDSKAFQKTAMYTEDLQMSIATSSRFGYKLDKDKLVADLAEICWTGEDLETASKISSDKREWFILDLLWFIVS